MTSKKKRQKRWRILLLIWITGILLPIAWLSQQWAPAARLFNQWTEPEWVHIVMHLFLYAVMTWILCSLSPLKPGWQKGFLILVLIFGIALLQESFQVLMLGMRIGTFELLDFGIDIAGVALGYSLWTAAQILKQSKLK